MRLRNLIAAACALALSGCSYVYGLVATKIGDRLAFVVAPGSVRKPDCIRSIEVRAEGDVHAEPVPGDDRSDVLIGVFWKKTFDVTGCENPFPVFYGAPLKGKPFQTYPEGGPVSAGDRAITEQLRAGVSAKRLRVGVVYEVATTSRGGGSGGCRFRIRDDGSVENLSLTSAPSP
jgi:hypothetical protein